MAEHAEGTHRETTGGRDADEIRRDIERRREAIASKVTLLNDQARRALDWRSRPYLVLGLAALGGFCLARWIRPRPTPGERVAQTLADNLETMMQSLGHPPRRRVGLVQAGAAALAAAAARGAGDWALQNYLGRDGNGTPPAPDSAP
jgi:hypothetical protein